MNTNLKIYCIIPAYNEEDNIIATINDVKKITDNIIVVDDSSIDNTYSLSRSQNVTILNHIINRGQGASLQTGNEYALFNKADIVVHFDADGQFKASEINDIVKPIIKNEADIVFGSRFLGKKSNIPFFKKVFILPLAKIFNKIFFDINLTDPQNGFRAMNQKALNTIKIENDGAAHCNEILIKSFKNKLRIKEIPVSVIYNHFGQSLLKGKGRGAGGLKIVKDLVIEKFIN
jgi:glycosyltransferase involved in cell wall biosynthesis